MKIGIILCLAKYYHRLNTEKVNSFINISVPLLDVEFSDSTNSSFIGKLPDGSSNGDVP